MKYTKPRSDCRDCGHHKSAHIYNPADQGRAPPAKCSVPGCSCTRYVQAAKGERVKRK